jgi:organic radical activating enzyme
MPKEGISLIGHSEILSYEEIIRVAKSAALKGISKIRITGGEPLVRKGINDLVGALNHIPGINELSITTNGILLEACAESLYRAGIKRINISLDTLDPEKYKKITRGGDITTVIAGIRKARESTIMKRLILPGSPLIAQFISVLSNSCPLPVKQHGSRRNSFQARNYRRKSVLSVRYYRLTWINMLALPVCFSCRARRGNWDSLTPSATTFAIHVTDFD